MGDHESECLGIVATSLSLKLEVIVLSEYPLTGRRILKKDIRVMR